MRMNYAITLGGFLSSSDNMLCSSVIWSLAIEVERFKGIPEEHQGVRNGRFDGAA